MLSYFVGQALAQAYRYKLQTLLIIVAVGIGIANIIVLISMTDLGRRQTMALINDFGARVIIVTPFIDFSSGPFAALSPANTNGFLPTKLYETLRDSPVVDHGPQGGAAAMLILPGNAELLPQGAASTAAATEEPKAATPAATSADEHSAAEEGADSAPDTVTAAQPGDEAAADESKPRGRNHFTTMAGVTPEFVNVGGTHVVAGRWITAEEEASGAHVVCLGATPLKALFGPQRKGVHDSLDDAARDRVMPPDEERARAEVKVDPQLAIGREILIKGEKFTIIGVMVERGRIGFEDVDNRVFMPLSTLQKLFDYSVIQGLILRFRPGMREDEAMKEVRATIAAALPPDEPIDDTVSTFTVKQATQLMDATLGIFRAVLWGVGSIALLVAGIGIMNVMLIRVLQRRTEIGLRRACGATQRSVVAQFVTESTVQAMLGAVVGLILGVIGVAIFCRYSQWHFYISATTILLAVSFAALVGVLFGAYPAWRAARVDPIQSLRSEM